MTLSKITSSLLLISSIALAPSTGWTGDEGLQMFLGAMKQMQRQSGDDADQSFQGIVDMFSGLAGGKSESGGDKGKSGNKSGGNKGGNKSAGSKSGSKSGNKKSGSKTGSNRNQSKSSRSGSQSSKNRDQKKRQSKGG